MATATQISTFIDRIAPLCQKAYRELGKIKPSVAIGMACVECAYGTAGSVKHNSLLGQKVGTGRTAKRYWSGKFFTANTKEEYTIGNHTIIQAAFRAYDSYEQCIFNYYELLNTSLYAKVKADASYSDQMKQIKACGYMTSSTEVNSVLTIISTYDLTKYDSANGNPYPTPEKTLREGDKGDGVRWLQWTLNETTGAGLAIDGIFGKKTLEAVKLFQTGHSLVDDGLVGTKTREGLLAVVASK